MRQLDSELLRTFLAIAEAGSVTGGAARINRSQSAASLQIKSLEETVGRPLFSRHGRGVALTAAGERLLPTARRVARTLDAALAELRSETLSGALRLGAPDDHGDAALTRMIAEFGARHRMVELEARCEAGTTFGAALDAGRLDLAVFETPEPRMGDETLREDRLCWMSNGDPEIDAADVLPVALFDRACWWRDAALSGLAASDRRHRVAFTSESPTGVRAAVKAGVAAGLLRASEAGDDLKRIQSVAVEHPTFLVLRKSPRADGAAVDAMAAAIRQAFA